MIGGDNKKKEKNDDKEMDKEIELQFYNVDTDQFREKLQEVGAELVQPKIIMPLIVFTHPQEDKEGYIRIRHEGRNITMTSKTDLKAKYVTEYEIIIDDFINGVKILKSLGCKKKYYVEKLRETWNLPGCKEIVIDSYPGIPEYIEVDCHSEDDLHRAMKLLGLKKETKRKGLNEIYMDLYGVIEDRETKDNLTFKNAHKVIGRYVIKNKKKFNAILKEQNKYYSTLDFDPTILDDII